MNFVEVINEIRNSESKHLADVNKLWQILRTNYTKEINCFTTTNNFVVYIDNNVPYIQKDEENKGFVIDPNIFAEFYSQTTAFPRVNVRPGGDCGAFISDKINFVLSVYDHTVPQDEFGFLSKKELMFEGRCVVYVYDEYHRNGSIRISFDEEECFQRSFLPFKGRMFDVYIDNVDRPEAKIAGQLAFGKFKPGALTKKAIKSSEI